MPSQWTAHRAPDGRPYWYNSQSKESVWVKPEGAPDPAPVAGGADAAAAVAAAAEAAAAAAFWTEHRTAEGVPYYHNSKTKKTVWEKPAEYDPQAVKRTASAANLAGAAAGGAGAAGASSMLDEVDQMLSTPSSAVGATAASRHSKVRMEAVEQFKSLLLEHKLPSNASFGRTAQRGAIIRDPRWAALNSITERRAAFSKYLSEQQERERTEFEELTRTQRAACLAALNERASALVEAVIKHVEDQKAVATAATADESAASPVDEAKEGASPADEAAVPGSSNGHEKPGSAAAALLTLPDEKGASDAEKLAHWGWARVADVVSKEPCFAELESDEDREFYFETFKRATESAERKRKAAQADEDRAALRSWLRELPEFEPGMPYRRAARLIDEHPVFSKMSELDCVRCFDKELRRLQHATSAADKEERERERIARCERRDQFRVLLEELADPENMERDGPLLTRRSVWSEFSKLPEVANDPRYQAICGQPGSHPAELFDDVVERVEAEFREQRRALRRFLAASKFPLSGHSFQELLVQVKGTDDEAAGAAMGDEEEGAVGSASVETLRAAVPKARVVLRTLYDNERVDRRSDDRKALLRRLGPDGEGKFSVDSTVEEVADAVLASEREALLDAESEWERSEARRTALRAAKKFLRRLNDGAKKRKRSSSSAKATDDDGSASTGNDDDDGGDDERKKRSRSSSKSSRDKSSSKKKRRKDDGSDHDSSSDESPHRHSRQKVVPVEEEGEIKA